MRDFKFEALVGAYALWSVVAGMVGRFAFFFLLFVAGVWLAGASMDWLVYSAAAAVAFIVTLIHMEWSGK